MFRYNDVVMDKTVEGTVKSLDGVFLITVRLILNLVTNILIFLTVFMCVLFSCRTKQLTLFDLHIILCVLGYQFFMCQGILVLSKYNSWTVVINRRYRKKLHWILQVLAVILIIAGSVMMIKEKHTNFNTVHGILALCALILCIVSILNGAFLHNAHITSSEKLIALRLAHFITGISTLFCATASLCVGFNTNSFKNWMENDNAVKCLMSITWLFTLAVSMEFWISVSSRLRKLFS